MHPQVVILGGNARSGKTTLAMMLQKAGWHRVSFDPIVGGMEALGLKWEQPEEELFAFFESMVTSALGEAESDGIRTVIDMYDFLPAQVARLQADERVAAYFLAYPGQSVEQIKHNVVHYARPTDWIAQVNEEYLAQCAERFAARNAMLQQECARYNARLVNTGAGDERPRALQALFEEINA